MESTEFDARRYWSRRLDRDWTLHGVGMRGLSRSYNRWMYSARRHVFRRTARTLPIDLPHSRVLDVGSGTGFYVELWSRLGAGTVTGVDIADSAVRRLRKRFPHVRFERLDIAHDDVSLLGDGFDVVSAFDVLFHVMDDDGYRTAMANVHRLLRPGGLFVFSEHFVRGPRREYRHHVSRPAHEIERAVTETGFEVVRRRPMLVLMAWPAQAAAPVWRRLWSRALGPALKSERWGGIAGAALYLVELPLTRLLAEGPSMEIMVCRKPPGVPEEASSGERAAAASSAAS